MTRNRGMVHANSSIIAMLQRVSDIFIILLTTCLISYYFSGDVTDVHFLSAFVTLSMFQLICGMTDYYRSWRGVRFSIEIQLLIKNWFFGVLFGYVVISFIIGSDVSIKYYAYWFLISSVGLIAARSFVRFAIHQLRTLGYNKRNIVIVGDSNAGFHFIDNIIKSPWLGFNVVGYYMEESNISEHYEGNNINYLGNTNELIEHAKNGGIDRVYIALSTEDNGLINQILSELSDTTCTAFLIPDVFTYNVLQSRSEIVNGIPVISLYDSPMSGVNMVIKRIEDIVLSTLIIALISPLLLVIACVIKLTSPGPVIFKQTRYGMDGKEISVFKFRSMTVMENDNSVVQAKKNDPRVTPFGAFLRKTSLDELPQFFNVICGDMSIVGPRPHAVAHNEQYRKLIHGYMMRHKMKPGITGWAQINGWRGETDTLEKMEKRIEYDLQYIQSWSLWLDLKIIFLTVFKGFVNKSAY
ncbi:undecaprenyl-phosphate glucose phosphotransferase [Pectobacterium versatile]|uniref:undecaprenyl-phosphate glucose phosphotransferase n=1 Tax=Pectobacterium versatile TaxID=2488639 RepID=UPI001F276EF1|nr:undecaprenyl-phosphate glucose phosphotransferase [Pectobacterium versatile]